MRIKNILGILIVGIFIFSTFTVLIPAVTGASVITRTHNLSNAEYSLNWSGYAVTGSKGSATFVSANWVIPTIQGTCTSTNQYSSFWVGIDGYSSSTVEQTGTDSDCQNGQSIYYAWYEFYPQPSFLISGMTISPGDSMYASVTYLGHTFTLFIQDLTTGISFTKSGVVHATETSAEWIAEAPSSSGGILPLADFGKVMFANGQATVNGTTAYINDFPSASVHQIDMVTNSGVLKASTSNVKHDGDFSVIWDSSGP